MDFNNVIAPLAAFWVAIEALMKMATFLNSMREAVIIGSISENKISLAHRKTILIDWSLSIIGFISTLVIYGFVLIAIAESVSGSKLGIYAVAFMVNFSAILFTICGISDYRSMKRTLSKEKAIAHQCDGIDRVAVSE